MVPIVGVLFWILALCSLVRIVAPRIRDSNRSAIHVAGWTLLLLLSALLLLRPHEDILGGEDPGAYLNAAISFSRHGSLFHIDPLLAQVPIPDRSEFFYGHAGFNSTKDACLWIHDLNKAIVGPWFQPAYSIMLSAPAGVTPRIVLYGAPLLGLMTALVLACIAARLLKTRWAAPITFLLYCLSPVVMWNARAPRAEMGATFFYFAGWALLLSAWERHKDRVSLDLCLSLLCFAVAPFFHITAWYGVLASFAILLFAALKGRRDFLLVIPVSVISVTTLAIQSYSITDCYTLFPFFARWLAQFRLLAPLALMASALCIGLSFRNHSRTSSVIPSPFRGEGRGEGARNPAKRWPAWIVAVTVPLLILAVALLRDDLGHVPLLPANAVRLFILTDIRGLVRLFSLPVTLAALIGWLLLALARPGTPGAFPRWIFLAAMAPGILMTGWMDNYMMETRRMMIIPAPIMILCITAFICACASAIERFPLKHAAPVLAILLTLSILGAMMVHKSILYRTTEYRGLYTFLKPIANEIRRHNGILLGEYSRIAAPFNHFFGIPLLSLDSDRRHDYRRAEKAWLDIMQQNPSRPAYFLSPYSNPVSAYFDFTPVMEKQYAGEKLSGSKRSIPTAPRQFNLSLRLFRMLPKGSVQPSPSFTRTFDAGNMGLTRFANLSPRPRVITVYPIPHTNDMALTMAPYHPTLPLFLFFHTTSSITPALTLQLPFSAPEPLACSPLTAGWWVAVTTNRLASPDAGGASLAQAGTQNILLRSTTENTFLCNIVIREENRFFPVGFSTSSRAHFLQPPVARWAQDSASLLVPVATNRPSLAYCLLSSPPGHYRPDSHIMESGSNDSAPSTRLRQYLALDDDMWRWRAIPISGDSNQVARIYFHAGTPWNPALRNFPTNLAVQVGAVVTLPTP